MKYQNRMRALREDNDLKQKQVAEVLGVAQNTYSQYETGARELPIDLLIALCRYYKVSSDYLAGLVEK